MSGSAKIPLWHVDAVGVRSLPEHLLCAFIARPPRRHPLGARCPRRDASIPSPRCAWLRANSVIAVAAYARRSDRKQFGAPRVLAVLPAALPGPAPCSRGAPRVSCQANGQPPPQRCGSRAVLQVIVPRRVACNDLRRRAGACACRGREPWTDARPMGFHARGAPRVGAAGQRPRTLTPGPSPASGRGSKAAADG